MKFPWTLNVLAGLCLLGTTSFANAAPNSATEPLPVRTTPLTNEEIRDRIDKLNLPFDARITPVVREYIKRYTVNGYRDSELILGRAASYFPIFDHYLGVYELPKSLKYLPIVESALLPAIKSHAGAAGLWQFVSVSAKHFKLEMNGVVDERLDPYRSTEAAVKMLAYLYKELEDWPLALAAYNCGLGRVKQAIRRAGGCLNYWDIQKYLPQDTRRYVPAFIAAAYLGNYYQEHGLNPRYTKSDIQDTRVFRVYERVSFSKLAESTGLSINDLTRLNPGYVRKYIPYNRKGHLVRIPAGSVSAVRAYLDQLQDLTLGTPEGYFETFYTVTPGDRVETLTSLFQCTKKEIMDWNGLYDSDIVVNQHLRIYLPKTNRIRT